MADNCKLFFLLICLCCSSHALDIKTFKIENLNLNDGFSSMRVVCIYQDRNGFLWFGTSAGLNRYDGYEVKEFLYQPDDSTSLSHSQINAITEDDNGNLWFATGYAGLNKLRSDGERFFQIRHDPTDSRSLGGNALNAIHFDQKKNLWVGARLKGGLSRLLVDDSTSALNKKWAFDVFKHDRNDSSTISHSSIKVIYEDDQNRLWIGTYNGLNRFDYRTGRFSRYLYNEDRQNKSADVEINAILRDKKGTLWIGTEHIGLLHYEKSNDRFLQYRHFKPEAITALAEDHKGFIWIGTAEDGIYLINHQYELYAHIRYSETDPYSLSDNSIHDITVDRSGIIWIGTDAGCISKFDWKKQQFSHLFKNPGQKYGLNGRAVSSIIELDSQSILIGTLDGGVDYVNLETGIVENYGIFLSDSEREKLQEVNTLYRDMAGTIWVGTKAGLCILEFDKKRIMHYNNYLKNPENEKYTSLPVECIYQNEKGYLWIGTHGSGLYKFDKVHEIFNYFKHQLGDSTTVGGNYIHCFYEDNGGNFWCGNGGLNIFDKETDSFRPYRSGRFQPDNSEINYIASIFEDQNDVLWLTSVNKGLIKYDRRNKVVKIYTKKDGLPDNTAWCTLQDKTRNLWISTSRGISRFNPATETFTNFDIHDGLQSNQFISSSNLKGSSGRLYMGGVYGLNIFYPDSIKLNPYVPEIVITDFTIFNESVLPGKHSSLKKSITTVKEINLTYRDYIFGFKFSALDYSIPDKNVYAYQMEGFDSDWIYTDNHNRYATYTNLDPGEYIFHVKGSNNDGAWNEEGTSIRVIITPPWWKTGWAYGLYFLLTVSLVYGVYRFQMNRLKMRHQLEMEHLHAEKLEEVSRMKSHFFANISHEFRTPLTLILGPLERLLTRYLDEDSHQELKIMQRSARRLQRLINQLLDLSKLEAGRMKLQVRKENIVVLIRNLVQAFESLAKLKNIQLKFRSKQKNIFGYIDREKLETIVNNLLSNAFKFTLEGGTISVIVHNPPVSPLPSGSASLTSMYKGGITTEVVANTKGASVEYIQINVSDTGSGIPTDRLPHIFDRFYQVDDSYSRDHEGTGIGLALTRELVEFHKGDITTSSEVGKGTTFVIHLPISKETYSKNEIVEMASPLVPPLPEKEEIGLEIVDTEEKAIQEIKKPIKKSLPILLIVEDNVDMRNYLRSNLENCYRITEAANGEEGFQKAAQKMPDLIISDVMMPEMDGFQLCAKLKTDQRTSHIPVILLTARASAEDRIGGLETGADDYIIKPFDTRELQVRVRNLIEQRRKLRERYRKEGILQPQEIAATSTDQKFLEKALQIIELRISDENFSVEAFGKEIGMSRVQLHRKLRALTDYSAGQFIRTLRLNRAAQLLSKHCGNVTEVAYEVGFKNLSYFAKCFHNQFGVNPHAYEVHSSPIVGDGEKNSTTM